VAADPPRRQAAIRSLLQPQSKKHPCDRECSAGVAKPTRVCLPTSRMLPKSRACTACRRQSRATFPAALPELKRKPNDSLPPLLLQHPLIKFRIVVGLGP
jgi:hypothetical protein